MTSEEAAYIAGLFDGEGSINIKRGIEKKKKHKNKLGYRLSNSMRISMEITMTDKSVLIWVHEVLGVGTLKPKTVRGTRKDGTPYLKQYKCRCVFRDAYLVSCALFPYAHVKLDKIQKVIDYYASRDLKVFNNKVVSLDEYKESMNLE